MEWHPSRRFDALVAAFAAVLAVVAVSAGPATAQSRIVTMSDDSKHAGEFVVPINKSQILQLDVPFADLLMTDGRRRSASGCRGERDRCSSEITRMSVSR